MLPRQHRLPKSIIIPTLRTGKKVFGQYIRYIYVKTDQPHSRFCIIVSKKKGMSAVRRNRIKRLVRNAVNKNLISCHSSIDVVVLVHSLESSISQQWFMNEIDQFFQKIV